MKMILTILALLIFSISLNATPPDSCLKMFCPNDTIQAEPPFTGRNSNPDSVKVDSCIGSPTYGKLFANRYFYLNFKVNNFPFDYQLKPDTIKKVSDVSTSKPELKAQFQQLESQYGTIFFQGRPEEEVDSEFWKNPGLRISFSNYQDIEVILDVFTSNIDSLNEIMYLNQAVIYVSVDENVEISNDIQLYPNPVKDILDLISLTSSSMDRISIYNLNGLKVLESNYTEQINVSELQPGIYFIRCGNKTYKFIKQN